MLYLRVGENDVRYLRSVSIFALGVAAATVIQMVGGRAKTPAPSFDALMPIPMASCQGPTQKVSCGPETAIDGAASTGQGPVSNDCNGKQFMPIGDIPLSKPIHGRTGFPINIGYNEGGQIGETTEPPDNVASTSGITPKLPFKKSNHPKNARWIRIFVERCVIDKDGEGYALEQHLEIPVQPKYDAMVVTADIKDLGLLKTASKK
jgi:hypothetical protein